MSKGNRKRRKAAGLLPTRERCAARNRFGERCKKYPIEGGVVCASHGGAAPQVRKKAQERLALAMDDAAALLIRFAHDPDVPPNIRLAAVKDILDRGGIGTRQELEVVLKPWEADIEGVLIDAGDDEVIEGEIVEEEPRAIPPSDTDWAADRLPVIADDTPRTTRSGPRLRGR